MKQPVVNVRVEYTDGYEKRYTEAVLRAYQKQANRDRTVIGGVFFPDAQRGRFANEKKRGSE